MDATNRTSGVAEPRSWDLPEALWDRIQPLLPPRPAQPLGCQRPRVEDRCAMDASCCVLRTGCPWNALTGTGICSSSSAHRRFQEWTQAGGFERLWALALAAYDALQAIQWAYQALDGALTNAPLGGKKTGPHPTGRGKTGTKRSVLVDGRGAWVSSGHPPGRRPARAPSATASCCCRKHWIVSPPRVPTLPTALHWGGGATKATAAPPSTAPYGRTGTCRTACHATRSASGRRRFRAIFRAVGR